MEVFFRHQFFSVYIISKLRLNLDDPMITQYVMPVNTINNK